MNTIIKKLTSRKGRVWLYSTGIAIVALLVSYGVITNELATAWSALLAPLFGLAIANVPNDKDQS